MEILRLFQILSPVVLLIVAFQITSTWTLKLKMTNNDTDTEDNSLNTTKPEYIAHNSHKNLNFTIKSRRKDVVHSTNYTSGQSSSFNLTSEDLKVRADWGGNCTSIHWNKCVKEEILYGKYLDDESKIQDDPTRMKKINCKFLPYWCHRNGWTINQCHILCMSRCSRELLSKLDRYIKHEGECSYL